MSGQMQRRWTVLLDGTELPDRAEIGGKAWSIARMSAMGLNVPAAFVITTKACKAYLSDATFPAELQDEIDSGISWLETRTGRKFGAGASRLLLSVRSGAVVSMPGMMDTVLNLGLDAEGEAELAAETGRPVFARDTHRRLCELYASVVLKAEAGMEMPTAPRDQLRGAVCAVFDSWNTRRAKRYRQHNGIADDLGTAVTIQAMVFGNLDERSGTGVLFSRNPLTGDPKPFGEYLPCAQGEDVVSGRFTPLPLDTMTDHVADAHCALLAAAAQLERAEGDVQDIEFTVQRGELFLLQTRSAKRSPQAAARIAVDLATEGLISIDVALGRVSAEQAAALLRPQLAPGAVREATLLLKGEGACPGIASGVAVADPGEAERRAAAGEVVILVREITSPDDLHGMIAAQGIVTAQGGTTSHAAVVSRALGKPCVVGAGAGVMALAGRVVTVDGTGSVYAGSLSVLRPQAQANPILSTLIEWAAARSPVRVVEPHSEAAPKAAFDMDAHPEATDPAQWATLLAGQLCAKGAVLATAPGAKIAYLSGVRTLVTAPILPALLAIIAAAREATA